MRTPRLALVLLLLTAMVALFGWRFANDANVRRSGRIAREAGRLFAEWRQGGGADPGAPLDPAVEAAKASAAVGRRVLLPSGGEVAYIGTYPGRVGKRAAAVVRLRISGEPFLLLVVSRGGAVAGASGGGASPFPGGSLLSGEREGIAFVLWDRYGLDYCLASDRELTRVFESVRRHFR